MAIKFQCKECQKKLKRLYYNTGRSRASTDLWICESCKNLFQATLKKMEFKKVVRG